MSFPSLRGGPPPAAPERSSTATVVGILFIVATVAYMVGQTLHAPILGAPEYLEIAHARRLRVVGGILFEVVGVLAIPLIALVFYPALRRHDETVALGYVGVRMLESTALLMSAATGWAIVSLSGSYL